MKLYFSKASKLIRKRIREVLESQEIEVKNKKILVPPFEVPYNIGSEIEGTMTNREMLIQLTKDVVEIKQDVVEIKQDIVEIKQDIKDMKNTPTMKRELKEMGK